MFKTAREMKESLIKEGEKLRLENLLTQEVESYLTERTAESIEKGLELVEQMDAWVNEVLTDKKALNQNQISICNLMFKGRAYAILNEKDNCIKYHTAALEKVKSAAGKDITPLAFPFLQAMVADFKDVGADALSQKCNEELTKSVAEVFGTDNIFYLGYSFDYYAQLMTENFNLGF
jgi:hypothetical protein